MNLTEAERAKYERVWAIPNYGRMSPGERLVDDFIRIVKPDQRRWITDFGCGSAKATRALQKRGYRVRAVDFTRSGISRHRMKHIREFHEQCLWKMSRIPKSHYGYCTDVMEHIPVEATMLTIRSIMDHCEECFFQICTLPDEFGKAIGEPLHVTVMPFTWWRDRLADLTTVVDARDLMHAGIYHVRH